MKDNKKEKSNKQWHTPKQIELPQEINDYLFELLKSHKEETSKEFGNELINDEKTKEEYWSLIESFIWDEEKRKVYLTVKSRKISTTESGGSIF